jgi:hypothetical protein
MAVVNPLFQHVKDNNVDGVLTDLIMIYSRNERDEEGNTPLHYVRSVAVARTLLHPALLNYDVLNPIDKNARNNNGYTPLMTAIHDRDVANYLIDEGVDVNVFGNDGVTARSINLSGEIRERLDAIGAALGVQNEDWMQFLDPVNFEIRNENNIGGEVVGPERPELPAPAPAPAPALALPNAGHLNVPWGEEDPVSGERIRNGNTIVNWGNSQVPPAGPGKFYHKTTYNGMLHSGRPMVSPITRKPILNAKKYTARVNDPHRNVKTNLFTKGGRRGRHTKRKSLKQRRSRQSRSGSRRNSLRKSRTLR